jgi:hypothetical protein
MVNNMYMKKLLIMGLAVLSACIAGCKNDDWGFPDYPYQSVYFAYQYPVRTITLGEDVFDTSLDNAHKCQIMATVGGSYSPKEDITVNFTVDALRAQNLLFQVGGDPVTVMPSSYYSLSSNKMVIPKGKLIGGVEVQLTDAFFADPKALKNTYVIPVKITSIAGADSITRGKDFVLYAIKYVNTWHGNYLRRGKDVIVGKNGNTALNQNVTRHQQYVEKDQVVKLNSRSMSDVELPLVFKDSNGQNINTSVVLRFDGSGNCTVSSALAGTVVTGTGKFIKRGEKQSWGNTDRDAIYLNYEVEINQMHVATTDTLVLRDRAVAMETFTPVSK